MERQFDAVVIGSGISGLTCGAFLSRAGMRVCVCEKHAKTGGYAHSFKRGRYRFESGIHSVPLAADGFVFHLLRLLGVEDQIITEKHDSIFSFSTPDQQFAVPADLSGVIARLREDFPAQRTNITNLFDDMRRFYDALILPLFHFEENFAEKDHRFIAQYFNRSYKSHLERFISDERLVRVFTSQWPFWGMPPDLSATIYSVLAFYVHSLEGSHQIMGGFSKLTDALSLAITRRGGVVRTGVEITGMTLEENEVRSLITRSGEEIEAKLFVSNISPYLLHANIVPSEARNKLWLRRLAGLHPAPSALTVYCGLHRPVKLPGGGNLDFWFSDNDYSRIYREMDNWNGGEPNHLTMLQMLQPGESPTMMLFSFCRPMQSNDWKSDKELYGRAILKAAKQKIPELHDAIDYTEIASPETFERFTGNTAGSLYGFENSKDIYGETRMPNTTYLKNLFQTGHWCKPGGGVWNVMECGYTAANIILHKGAEDS